jgi:hypothetical protein
MRGLKKFDLISTNVHHRQNLRRGNVPVSRFFGPLVTTFFFSTNARYVVPIKLSLSGRCANEGVNKEPMAVEFKTHSSLAAHPLAAAVPAPAPAPVLGAPPAVPVRRRCPHQPTP